MIENLRRSVDGKREHLEELQSIANLCGRIIDYPARSCLYFNIDAGSPKNEVIERFIQEHGLSSGCSSEFKASDEELATEPLFTNVACRWIEDDEMIVATPTYTEIDRCPKCGKGAREHSEPLRGIVRGLSRDHLIRLPPALVLGSARLVTLIQQHEWTGVDVRPYVDKRTGRPHGAISELWLTSILAPMHKSAAIKRSTIPDYCDECRRLGYRLVDTQPTYNSDIVTSAADWNLSCEWLAPHYVSCPKLICSNRVVNELIKLEKSQRWIPVKLVE